MTAEMTHELAAMLVADRWDQAMFSPVLERGRVEGTVDGRASDLYDRLTEALEELAARLVGGEVGEGARLDLALYGEGGALEGISEVLERWAVGVVEGGSMPRGRRHMTPEDAMAVGRRTA